jgi:hypothetical protein
VGVGDRHTHRACDVNPTSSIKRFTVSTNTKRKRKKERKKKKEMIIP